MKQARVVRLLTVLVGGVVVAVAATLLAKERSVPEASRDTTTLIDNDTLLRAAKTRVFFGHQSVGANIIDGVSGISQDRGLAAPVIVDVDQAAVPTEGGFFAHAHIGQNGDPIGKIDDFARRIRAGLGNQVDVAFLKLCYVDIHAGSDTDAVFQHYRETMPAVQKESPSLRLLHLPAPLTTEATPLTRLKSTLKGRGSNPHAADNIARQRYNNLIRNAYGSAVIDVAKFESMGPTGTPNLHQWNDHTYAALDSSYASDSGHLNGAGSRIVAAQVLARVAETAP